MGDSVDWDMNIYRKPMSCHAKTKEKREENEEFLIVVVLLLNLGQALPNPLLSLLFFV
jgi:hypothetical protein